MFQFIYKYEIMTKIFQTQFISYKNLLLEVMSIANLLIENKLL